MPPLIISIINAQRLITHLLKLQKLKIILHDALDM